MQELYSCEEWA